MENFSKMNEVNTYCFNNSSPPLSNPAMRGGENNEAYNLEAHTSSNMKVKRPKVTPNDLALIQSGKKPFSDSEATKKIQSINTDIYEGAKQEKEKHEFNFKRYFTIFGIIALLTAAYAYFRRGK